MRSFFMYSRGLWWDGSDAMQHFFFLKKKSLWLENSPTIDSEREKEKTYHWSSWAGPGEQQADLAKRECERMGWWGASGGWRWCQG